MSDHKLFDIWEAPPESGLWQAQLVNFVGHFSSQETAQRYVDGVKKYREKNGIK